MGGERSSTTRQRRTGRICQDCAGPLPPRSLLQQHLSEPRVCENCLPPKKPPAAIRRVYMHFMLRGDWHCQFLEMDMQTSLTCKLNFATEDKVVELIRRSGGLKDSAAKQAVEHAISNGRGGVYLDLTEEQYQKLRRQP
jgi:hypothetical protein